MDFNTESAKYVPATKATSLPNFKCLLPRMEGLIFSEETIARVSFRMGQIKYFFLTSHFTVTEQLLSAESLKIKKKKPNEGCPAWIFADQTAAAWQHYKQLKTGSHNVSGKFNNR